MGVKIDHNPYEPKKASHPKLKKHNTDSLSLKVAFTQLVPYRVYGKLDLYVHLFSAML